MLAAAIYILNFSVEGRNGSASIPQKVATLSSTRSAACITNFAVTYFIGQGSESTPVIEMP